jgi:outer membrane protein OmpA-like peptidoglycan-associated protein
MKDYKEGFKQFSKYKKLINDPISKTDKENSYIRFIIELNTPQNEFTKTINLPSNSKYSEFGVHTKNDTMYYASSRTSAKNKVYLWNNEPFLDLHKSYYKFTNDSINIGDVLRIDNKELNTRGHESNFIITKDGKTAYFTRDDIKNRRKLNPDADGTVQLKLFRATLKDGNWQDFEKLPFNLEGYSIGHPALSHDEKTLYYVSDQPGGYGNTDIYSVEVINDGAFGTPKNMGKEINTSGREMFPFIDKENNLYFSSDTHMNLGLLDIFKSNILSKRNNEEIIILNLGAPYNSGYDDFAFNIDPETEKGFFSSDRPNGKGSDDIYAFYQEKQCKQIFNGIVTDELTKEPISGATVRLIDKEGIIKQNIKTDINGFYEFIGSECDYDFIIVGNKENYKNDEKSIKSSNKDGDITKVDLQLQPLIIGLEIVINPIYFDFDKDNIREDAAYELENIVNVLKDNPDMIIKIESHTDSRGEDDYNLKLSDRRAKSTFDYIVSRNIQKSRIVSALGYGEQQLLNNCSNNVKCTEKEHQLNRRSKFIIITNESSR